MHPSRASRLTVSPVAKFLKDEFGCGPPVPAAGLFALDECGHPNCCATNGLIYQSRNQKSVFIISSPPERNARLWFAFPAVALRRE